MDAAAVVKERPILFSGRLVRSLVAGTKTQTRRPMKPQPQNPETFGISPVWGWGKIRPGLFTVHAAFNENGKRVDRHLPCPYGAPGDRLWVRETHAVHSKPCEGQGTGYVLQFRADNAEVEMDADTSVSPTFDRFPHQKIADEGWRPSIHMPRWACRIVLEITDVRVERLRDISEEDAAAEGVSLDPPINRAIAEQFDRPLRYEFMRLWAGTYGADAVEANPYVWALTFRRVTP